MRSIANEQIHAFLEQLGEHYPKPETLYLLGGSALLLLGSSRQTLDIDYVGDDLIKDEFQNAIEETALKLGLETEAVPIQQFIPIAKDWQSRSLFFGTFGNIQVYIFDPYSIAVSKIERGFDTDLDDVIFLIKQGIINLEETAHFVAQAIECAQEFDIQEDQIRAHLEVIRMRFETK